MLQPRKKQNKKHKAKMFDYLSHLSSYLQLPQENNTVKEEVKKPKRRLQSKSKSEVRISALTQIPSSNIDPVRPLSPSPQEKIRLLRSKKIDVDAYRNWQAVRVFYSLSFLFDSVINICCLHRTYSRKFKSIQGFLRKQIVILHDEKNCYKKSNRRVLQQRIII